MANFAGNKNLPNFGLLFSNDHESFLSKKAERLASALYVITGFLTPEEPVRNRLRARALDLINLSSRSSVLSGGGVESFRNAATEIGMLLKTAHSGGLISKMNCDLLCEEYAGLALFVQKHADHMQGGSSGQGLDVSDIGNFSDDAGVSHNRSKKILTLSKGHQGHNGKNDQKNRRKILVELLNKKDKISIKDAVSAIEGCSEKTVQRELLSLVRDGIAVKEGERRWSTYRKAHLVSS